MRFITHTRDTVGDFQSRVLIHIPIGILNALLLLVHWSLVLAFTFMFWAYEKNEDVHFQDQMWKDLSGWLVGFILGGIILFILYIYGIINI